ncbi:MAG: hypothetical protein ACXACA_02860 [Candidatus Ranarchaeia archaeon]|jgi:hypothetical protein
MPYDLTIIGIVFALILVIIFFSAIVLYLAFRIKETFRKETRKGFTVVKIGFLIGILFLAGGIFYFFANTLGNMAEPSPTPSPSSPYLNLTVSYPRTVTVNTLFTMDLTIINPTTATAHGATIQANELFADFVIQSSTHEVVGNVIKIGEVPPGTTIVSLELSTPNKPGTEVDTVSLLFQEMTAPVTQQVTISVEGGPNSTPSPSPSPTPPPPSEPVLSLSVSYPSSVTLNSNITMSFTIRNLGSATAHGATIEANELFANFAVVSSTREVVGNVVNVGDVPPGTTIISLQLLSPTRPGTVVDTVSLLFQEMTAPVTQQITISIRGGP